MTEESCPLPHVPEPLQVDLFHNRPAVVLWDGDLALFFDDWMTDAPTFRGIGKAVTVARLRAIIELIESSGEDE